jgi:hypothetical protein
VRLDVALEKLEQTFPRPSTVIEIGAVPANGVPSALSRTRRPFTVSVEILISGAAPETSRPTSASKAVPMWLLQALQRRVVRLPPAISAG